MFYPFVGSGPLVGMAKAAREFRDLGVTESLPALYAAKSAACAPIVEAFDADADAHEPWDVPDTVCGALVLDALCETVGAQSPAATTPSSKARSPSQATKGSG